MRNNKIILLQTIALKLKEKTFCFLTSHVPCMKICTKLKFISYKKVIETCTCFQLNNFVKSDKLFGKVLLVLIKTYICNILSFKSKWFLTLHWLLLRANYICFLISAFLDSHTLTAFICLFKVFAYILFKIGSKLCEILEYWEFFFC